MSTQLNNTQGASALHTLPRLDRLSVGIVCAEWNEHTTGALLQGALDLFEREGYEDITVAHVPGTVELTFGAAQMARSGRFDANGEMPDWNTLDLSLSKDFRLGRVGVLGLNVTVRDLLDCRYELVRDYPMPGRSVLGGFTFKF